MIESSRRSEVQTLPNGEPDSPLTLQIPQKTFWVLLHHRPEITLRTDFRLLDREIEVAGLADIPNVGVRFGIQMKHECVI